MQLVTPPSAGEGLGRLIYILSSNSAMTTSEAAGQVIDKVMYFLSRARIPHWSALERCTVNASFSGGIEVGGLEHRC